MIISYEFDIDDVVMLNHHNFKLNETVAEDVTLPSLIDGLNTIDLAPIFKMASLLST
jgi:hypothetical protein